MAHSGCFIVYREHSLSIPKVTKESRNAYPCLNRLAKYCALKVHSDLKVSLRQSNKLEEEPDFGL